MQNKAKDKGVSKTIIETCFGNGKNGRIDFGF